MFYGGGDGIDRFRGQPGPHRGPEDWVASLCRLPGALGGASAPDAGLSSTSSGELLHDLVLRDPEGWLGRELIERYGVTSALLVKLLDAGERLPVHCHPSRTFGNRHLGSIFGKTEGWIILEAAAGASVWLGLAHDVDTATLRRWIDRQDAASMLAAMNRIDARPGQVVFVPAGVPHSIGPGVMLTELQEPTSFSVLAEHASFGLDEDQATLGLGWDVAQACFDLGAYRGQRLQELLPTPVEILSEAGGRVSDVFGDAADEFFAALLVRCSTTVALRDPSFAVLIVTGGAGTLGWSEGVTALRRGETWVVPYGAGPVAFSGEVEAIVCLPPRPRERSR